MLLRSHLQCKLLNIYEAQNISWKSYRERWFMYFMSNTLFFLKYGFQGDYTKVEWNPQICYTEHTFSNLIWFQACTKVTALSSWESQSFLPLELTGLHACKCLLDVNIAEHGASTIASLKFKRRFFQNNNY